MRLRYVYVDTPEALVLCRVSEDGRSCESFVQGTIDLRGRKMTAVPRAWARIGRGPTVIWKKGVSDDVKLAVATEMVDLRGLGEPASGKVAVGLLVAGLVGTVWIGLRGARYGG